MRLEHATVAQLAASSPCGTAYARGVRTRRCGCLVPAHASLETGGLASRAPRACHSTCAASCLEPMRHGVRAARVHQLVASAPVCPVRAEAAWIMQPSALHGALRACRRLHATTWRGADARKRPPPCPRAGHASEVRLAASVQTPGHCVSFTRQHAAARPSRLCPRRRRRLSAWRRLVQAPATAGTAPRACACACACCVRGTACVGGTRTRERLRVFVTTTKRPRCCNTLCTLLRLAGA